MFKIESPNKLIIGHLNINSIRNKFECLFDIVGNIDIFLISESKLNNSFPNGQFLKDGFHVPFRKDRTFFFFIHFFYLRYRTSQRV